MNTKKTSVETRGSCFCAIENGTHPFAKPKKEKFLFFQTRADIARYVYFYENNYIYIYFYLYIYIRTILQNCAFAARFCATEATDREESNA